MKVMEELTKEDWNTHIVFTLLRKGKSYPIGVIMNSPGDLFTKEYLEWWRDYESKSKDS